MARVIVPSLMRDITDGASELTAAGGSVLSVLEALDQEWPGLLDRLLLDGELDPALVVLVDGRPVALGLHAPVEAESEIRFLPAIGGG